MNWLNVLGSGGIAVVIVAAFQLWQNRMTLRANAPAAGANVEGTNIENLIKVLDQVKLENARLVARLDKVETSAAETNQKMIETNQKMTTMSADHTRFKGLVEDLLEENHIGIPIWWHNPPTDLPE